MGKSDHKKNDPLDQLFAQEDEKKQKEINVLSAERDQLKVKKEALETNISELCDKLGFKVPNRVEIKPLVRKKGAFAYLHAADDQIKSLKNELEQYHNAISWLETEFKNYQAEYHNKTSPADADVAFIVEDSKYQNLYEKKDVEDVSNQKSSAKEPSSFEISVMTQLTNLRGAIIALEKEALGDPTMEPVVKVAKNLVHGLEITFDEFKKNNHLGKFQEKCKDLMNGKAIEVNGQSIQVGNEKESPKMILDQHHGFASTLKNFIHTIMKVIGINFFATAPSQQIDRFEQTIQESSQLSNKNSK